jgi:hypothetical protein
VFAFAQVELGAREYAVLEGGGEFDLEFGGFFAACFYSAVDVVFEVGEVR